MFPTEVFARPFGACKKNHTGKNNQKESKMNETKGFFGSLFDLSFSQMITTKLVKVFYIITIVISGLIALGMIIGGFSNSAGTGFFMLILAPIVFILQIIFSRIWLELVVVAFKIADNTSYLVPKNNIN